MAAHQAPPSLGFSRQEHWSELPFPSSKDLSHPGIELTPLYWQADSFQLSHQRRQMPKNCIKRLSTPPSIAAAAAAAAKSLQSCPTLCDPIDGSPPGSPVPGILQARTLEWVAISFSNAWKWKVKVKSLSVRLLETPWTAAHQAPPSMGFSRREYWSGVPLPSPKVTPYSIKLNEKVYVWGNPRILPVFMCISLGVNSVGLIKPSDYCGFIESLDFNLMKDLSQNLPAKLLQDYWHSDTV